VGIGDGTNFFWDSHRNVDLTFVVHLQQQFFLLNDVCCDYTDRGCIMLFIK